MPMFAHHGSARSHGLSIVASAPSIKLGHPHPVSAHFHYTIAAYDFLLVS